MNRKSLLTLMVTLAMTVGSASAAVSVQSVQEHTALVNQSIYTANDIILSNFPELSYKPAPPSVVAEKAQVATHQDTFFNEKGALAIVQEGKKQGLVGLDGQVLIPATHERILPFYPTGVFYAIDGKERKMFDAKGQEISEEAAKELPRNPYLKEVAPSTEPSDSYTSFTEKGKVGFKNTKTDQVVIAPAFKDAITEFSEGIAFVKNDKGKKVAINAQGQELFEAPYDVLLPYQDGLAEYQRKVGGFNFGSLIGLVGGGIISHGHGFIIGGIGGNLSYDGVKRGYLDKSGNVVIDSKNDAVYPMTPYGTFVKNDGTLSFVNRQGQVLLSSSNYGVGSIDAHTGLLSIEDKASDKYGIFSAVDGKQIIPFTFDSVEFIGANRMVAGLKGSKELIDLSNGKSLQAFKSDATFTGFGLGGLTWVKEDGHYRIINQDGQTTGQVTEDKISEVTPFVNGYSVVKSKGKWGVMNSQGQWAVQPIYKDIELL